MEDVLVWLIWGAILIGGAVSSANKKKRKREAARNASQPGQNKGRGFVSKSLTEILQELEGKKKMVMPEERYVESIPEDYYVEEMTVLAEEQQMASFEEQDSAAARLEAMTYKPMVYSLKAVPTAPTAPTAVKSVVETPILSMTGELESDETKYIFDLRSAIIGSEILRPKFKQY